MVSIDNGTFLRTIFGDQAARAHITSFFDSPDAIQPYARGRCWAGGPANEYFLSQGSNQYFTISLFHRDPTQPLKSLRRKALFDACYVIVADDVKDKVPAEQALRLPPPTYRLETSPGNEQWGWVLSRPETDRSTVENLLDGLVAQGLAPDGTDPGMKGVTRYVRLPEGYNRKIKYLGINNAGFKCQMLEWKPERRVDIESLAAPFGIDLDAPRDEGNGELIENEDIGLADHHPALKYIEPIGKLGEGKFSVVCPWVEEHTDGDDSGTAIFLLAGGKVGFKCHHGHCQDKTWNDVLRKFPVDWMFEGIEGGIPDPVRRVEPGTGVWLQQGILDGGGGADQVMDFQTALGVADSLRPDDIETIQAVINAAAEVSAVEKEVLRSHVMDSGAMSGKGFDAAIKARWKYLKTQRVQAVLPGGLLPDGTGPRYVFIGEQNAFWDVRARIFVTREGYNGLNGASRDDGVGQTPSQLLLETCPKAAKLTYHPGIDPGVVKVDGVNLLNTWTPSSTLPVPDAGEPEPWLQHARILIPDERERETLIDWIAWTLQNQNQKSNWQVLLAGYQGSGKDTLLLPLKEGIGRNNTIEIPAARLLEPYEDYLKHKLLVVQEIENFEKRSIQNRLKRILASSGGNGMKVEPLTVRVFGQKHQVIPNLVQTVFMSNHRSSALQVSQNDRRIFAIWSDFNPGQDPMWAKYFSELHQWLTWEGPTGVEYPDGYGIGITLDWLLRRDVSGFQARGRAPMTGFKEHLIEHSRSNVETIVLNAIEDREGPFVFDLVKLKAIRQWIKREHEVEVTEKTLSTILTRIDCTVLKDLRKKEGRMETHRYWLVRDIEKWVNRPAIERIKAFDEKGVKDYLFGGPKLIK